MDISNSFLINYGKASVSSQEEQWNRPNLTSNGTLGGNSFAVWANKNTSDAYKAFDSNTSTSWDSDDGTGYLITYNPNKIRIVQILIQATYTMTACTMQGSDDNSNWTTLTTTFANQGGGRYLIQISDSAFYHYYKIFPTNSTTSGRNVLTEVTIWANYITYVLNSITFPQAFTTTNYAYSLAYLNGLFGNSYATDLTTTGMTLQNNSNGTNVYYLAIGY